MTKREAIIITTTRKSAYWTVMKELDELKSFFHDDVELVSAETGEVFTIKEIGRVLGILSGLVANQVWCPEFIEDEDN